MRVFDLSLAGFTVVVVVVSLGVVGMKFRVFDGTLTSESIGITCEDQLPSLSFSS